MRNLYSFLFFFFFLKGVSIKRGQALFFGSWIRPFFRVKGSFLVFSASCAPSFQEGKEVERADREAQDPWGAKGAGYSKQPSGKPGLEVEKRK